MHHTTTPCRPALPPGPAARPCRPALPPGPAARPCRPALPAGPAGWARHALLAILATLALLTHPAPAHAGQYTVSFSGGKFSDDFGITYDDYDDGVGDYYTYNISSPTNAYAASGTITVTCTWTPDQGKDMTTDPPPQSALVDETGYAYWEGNTYQAPWWNTLAGGTCDDGMGDLPTSNTDSLPWVLSGSFQFNNHHYSVHGGKSFKITRSPSITPGLNGGVNGEIWYCVSVSQYTGTVKAGSTGQTPTTGQPGGPDGGGDGPPGGDTGGGPGSTSTLPYFSGTGCSVVATAFPLLGYVLHAQLKINGTLVAEYDDNNATALTHGVTGVTYNTDSRLPSYDLVSTFDSTYFADSSAITITMTGADSQGDAIPPVTLTGPAVNNAFLMYNNTNTVWDSSGNEAKLAADGVFSALSSSSHIKPSPEDYTDNCNGIEGQLGNPNNLYTVFFDAGHAAVGIFNGGYVLGDCLATPTNETSDWMKDIDITNSVTTAANSPNQPPYNFIYLHCCDGAVSSTFSNDFGIPSSNIGDRGGIGFTSNGDYNAANHLTPPGYVEDGELAVSQQNTSFTLALWQNLLSGETPYNANYDAVRSTNGAQEYYEPTQPEQPGMIGANNTEQAIQLAGSNGLTVAGGVYNGNPGQWFK